MATVTKEIVEAVKKYAKKYPNLTQDELSKLAGTSTGSVSNIVNGKYDYLLEEEVNAIRGAEKSIKSEIPYEAYRKLVSCELAIQELINSTKTSKVADDDCLFINYKFFDSVIRRYFPEEHAKRTSELYTEDKE